MQVTPVSSLFSMQGCTNVLFARSFHSKTGLKPGQVQDYAGDHRAGVQKAGEFDALQLVRIDLEKDDQPDARVGAQAGDDGGEGEGFAEIELSQQHGGGAVGDEPEKGRQKGLEDASI